MRTVNKQIGSVIIISLLTMLGACSQPSPPAGQASSGAVATSNGVGVTTMDPAALLVEGRVATEPAAPAQGTTQGFAPGESLAFEWSANGFEQIGAQYKWTGSGKRDDVFQPNFSLSVPETDDGIWSSSCKSNGMVETQIFLNPPANMKSNRAVFKFETDKSTRTLLYTAQYVADGMADGFRLVQSPNDPMFSDMKAGTWAYIQLGEGTNAVKLRVSLANALPSLNTFLPACSQIASAAPVKQVAPATKVAPKSDRQSVATNYVCEDGRSVSATYMGNDTDQPSVRLAVNGKTITLNSAVSGSGARFESLVGLNPGKRLTWLTKDTSGVLIETDRNDAEGTSESAVSCQQS
jgi:membrane-bound inhibitor of C-type lysozyme